MAFNSHRITIFVFRVLPLVLIYTAFVVVSEYKYNQRKTESDSAHAATDRHRRLTSCQRVCFNHYRNVILLDIEDQGSLDDRLNIFSNVLQLAGYLCAQVWVARPSFILNPHPDFGQDFNVNTTWNRFVNFVYISSSSSSSFETTARGDVSAAAAAARETVPLIDWANVSHFEQPPQASFIFQNPAFRNWFHVRTIHPDHIVKDWQQIEKVSFAPQQQRGGGFVWYIRADFHQWSNHLSDFLRARQQRKRQQRQDSSVAAPRPSDIVWQRDNINNYNETWRYMQPSLRSSRTSPSNSTLQDLGCKYVKRK